MMAVHYSAIDLMQIIEYVFQRAPKANLPTLQALLHILLRLAMKFE